MTKALLQSGVSYVAGYQGAPISHLMDVLTDANSILEELGGIRETLLIYPRRQGQREHPTATCLTRMSPLQQRLFAALEPATLRPAYRRLGRSSVGVAQLRH